MSPENFVYWLQGYFELSDNKALNESQTKVVQQHIALVLNKATSVAYPEKVLSPALADWRPLPDWLYPNNNKSSGGVIFTQDDPQISC